MFTDRTWERHNWSQEALGSRKFILNEFWHIFVHDSLIPRNEVNTHANAQPTSVFSIALTVMDTILGWEEERKWIGSFFAACTWIYSKAVLCNGRRPPEDETGRRLLAANWVCEDAFKGEHEWVTHLTISEWEEHVMVDLECNIDIPCVVQWTLFWFASPSRSNSFHGNKH